MSGLKIISDGTGCNTKVLHNGVALQGIERLEVIIDSKTNSACAKLYFSRAELVLENIAYVNPHMMNKSPPLPEYILGQEVQEVLCPDGVARLGRV